VWHRINVRARGGRRLCGDLRRRVRDEPQLLDAAGDLASDDDDNDSEPAL